MQKIFRSRRWRTLAIVQLVIMSMLMAGMSVMASAPAGEQHQFVQGGGNQDCPAGTIEVAKFNTSGNSYVLEGNNDGNVQITNQDLSGGDWSSDLFIAAIVVKGGPNATIDLVNPATTSGTFTNANIPTNGGGNTPDISNIKFCAEDPQPEPDTYELRMIKYNDLDQDGSNNEINTGVGEAPSGNALLGWEFVVYDNQGNEVGRNTTSVENPGANGDLGIRASLPGLISGEEYTICETQQAGWVNTQPGTINATYGEPCETVTLTSSTNVTRYFGNYEEEPEPETGSLTIIKDAQPDSVQSFEFTGSIGIADLVDDGIDNGNENSAQYEIQAGNQAVTEIAVDGWTLTSVVCTGTDSYNADLNAGSLSVDVPVDGDVVCTFVNVQDPPPLELERLIPDCLSVETDEYRWRVRNPHSESIDFTLTNPAGDVIFASGTAAPNGDTVVFTDVSSTTFPTILRVDGVEQPNGRKNPNVNPCNPPPDLRLNLTAECAVGDTLYWRVTNDEDVDIDFTFNGPGANDGNGVATANSRTYFTTQDAGGANTTIIDWNNPGGNNDSKTKAHNNNPCVYHVSFDKDWTGGDAPDLDGAVLLEATSSLGTATCTSDDGNLSCVYSTGDDLHVPFGETYSVSENLPDGWQVTSGIGSGFTGIDGFDDSALPDDLVYDVADDRFCESDPNADFPFSLEKFCDHTVTNEVAPPSERISPIVECVIDNYDGTFTARFGYNNLNDETIIIPVGSDNRFSPAPQDRGQTTEFAAGRGYADYEVEFDGNNLVWTLTGPDGSTRTATASSNTQRCSDQPPEMATVLIDKVVSGDNPDADLPFDFILTGNNNGTPFSISANDSAEEFELEPGTYTIIETNIPISWSLASIGILNPDGIGPITPEINGGLVGYEFTIGEGDKVTFTFVNDFDQPIICEDHPDNLVENGCFEAPVVDNNWDTFTSDELPGWDVEWVNGEPCTTDIAPALELQTERTLRNVDVIQGNQYAELDSDCDGRGPDTSPEAPTVRISQTLDTIPGNRYEVSFYFIRRPGSGTQELTVEIDGVEYFVEDAPNAWEERTFEFIATSSETVISFADTGHANTIGVLLDCVNVLDQGPGPQGTLRVIKERNVGVFSPDYTDVVFEICVFNSDNELVDCANFEDGDWRENWTLPVGEYTVRETTTNLPEGWSADVSERQVTIEEGERTIARIRNIYVEPERPPVSEVCLSLGELGYNADQSIENQLLDNLVTITTNGGDAQMVAVGGDFAWVARNAPDNWSGGETPDFAVQDRLFRHDYTFTFADDIVVTGFSLRIYDWSDYNPGGGRVDWQVSLTSPQTADSDGLAFTRNTSTDGDAFEAIPGQPGNRRYAITGNDLQVVELDFSDNGGNLSYNPSQHGPVTGANSADPYLGLDELCIDYEQTGSIAVQKYIDGDLDGIYDSQNQADSTGEGWEITVSDDNGVVASGDTNETGQIIFEDLPYGTYEVCEENRAGYNALSGLCQEVTVPQQQIPLVFVNQPIPTADTCGAIEVVSFNQGTDRSGNPIVASRSNPANALGAPQDNDTFNFVSLGFDLSNDNELTGELILLLDGIVTDDNGDDEDLYFVETSFGDPSFASYPESADVYGSMNPNGPWTLLGELQLDTAVDFPGDGLQVLYVRLVNTTDPNSFNSRVVDGYDLDGILCEEPNIPPVAVDDEKLVWYGSDICINVLANDYDPDGGDLIITEVTSASEGTSTLNNIDFVDDYACYDHDSDGSPAPGGTETDEFDYTIADEDGAEDSANVDITIARLDLEPVCEELTDTTITWNVFNPVSSSVAFLWDLNTGADSGAGNATPGNSTFTTPRLSDTDSVSILVGGNTGFSTQDTATIEGCEEPTGDLTIVKLIDWNDVEANNAVNFEICVDGQGCMEANYANGYTVTWTDLPVDSYNFSETYPGENWTVEYPGGQTAVVGADSENVYYVRNTHDAPPPPPEEQVGTITVIKNVVNAPAEYGNFTICIVNPIFPEDQQNQAACHFVHNNGDQVSWNVVIPQGQDNATYNVYEVTPLPEHWSAQGASANVTVTPNNATYHTVTNTYAPPPPPTCDGAVGPQSHLSGYITISGLTATGHVTNNSNVEGCVYPLGLASYEKYDEEINNQVLFASNLQSPTIAPGETYTFTVRLPECATQVDLFYGDLLTTFANGDRYGSRLFDAVHLQGNGYCAVEQPPVEQPPAQDPPAEDPPAEDPPAQDPPVQDPPEDTGSPSDNDPSNE